MFGYSENDRFELNWLMLLFLIKLDSCSEVCVFGYVQELLFKGEFAEN